MIGRAVELGRASPSEMFSYCSTLVEWRQREVCSHGVGHGLGADRSAARMCERAPATLDVFSCDIGVAMEGTMSNHKGERACEARGRSIELRMACAGWGVDDPPTTLRAFVASCQHFRAAVEQTGCLRASAVKATSPADVVVCADLDLEWKRQYCLYAIARFVAAKLPDAMASACQERLLGAGRRACWAGVGALHRSAAATGRATSRSGCSFARGGSAGACDAGLEGCFPDIPGERRSDACREEFDEVWTAFQVMVDGQVSGARDR
jgi:hypothetical protein